MASSFVVKVAPCKSTNVVSVQNVPLLLLITKNQILDTIVQFIKLDKDMHYFILVKLKIVKDLKKLIDESIEI